MRSPSQDEIRQALQDASGAAETADFDGLTGKQYVQRIRQGWSQRWTEHEGDD